MKIKGLTRQDEGGGYYRVSQPLGELGRHGHETVWEHAQSDAVAGDADVIVGQVIGGQNGWWRGLSRYARLVYEIDDDPFEIEPINPVYPIYSNLIAQDSIRHCIEVSDLVTVSTELLADRMRNVNPNVVVLQNRIDESMLTLERPKRDRITVGWAGGGSHGSDIALVSHALGRVIDQYSDVDVHFIGADFRFLVERPMRHTQWAAVTTDYYKLIDFDIGIAPLVDTRFAETKSHIKALEYAALGIPVIASDTAPYRDFVVDGVTGWLVRRQDEWIKRLRELICDEAMREEMSVKAREVATEWTIQKGWQEWEQCYKSLL